jgi:hypothetical protein
MSVGLRRTKPWRSDAECQTRCDLGTFCSEVDRLG